MAGVQSVADGESASVAIPKGQSSALNTDKREVTPSEDETVEEFAFRILGQKILKMLIMSELSSSPYFYCRRAVLCYRTVSKAWRDSIHQICFNIGPPLFEYRFYFSRRVLPERLLKSVLKLFSLLTSPHASSVGAPLSLDLNLACPPYFSDTNELHLSDTNKSGITATLFNSLKNMDKMILSLSLHLCHDSLEGNGWSSLEMENLKYLKFSWDGPIIPGATIHDLCPNVTVPALELPKSLEMLEMDEIKIPIWLVHIAPTLVNLKRLTLRAVSKQTYGVETEVDRNTLLIANFAKSLEYLRFEEPCHNIEIVIPEPHELPVAFNIVKPMSKLHMLEVDLTHWRIGELKGYKELLPSLVELTMKGYREDVTYSRSWYDSLCPTLRRLSIYFDIYRQDGPPLGENVLVALSQNFPNLTELKIVTKEFEGNNWQSIVCQGFPNLSKLVVSCQQVSAEGRARLVAAVSGIPLEELQIIRKNANVLENVINKYKQYPSLRDLNNLQELTLNVCLRVEGPYGVKTDCSVMVHSTFLQMPNLKLVELNSSFQLTDEIIKQARKQTGLIIRDI